MHLFLIPTAMERERLRQHAPHWFDWANKLGLVRLCGFGPIAAAARTSQLISRLAPEQVCLVGIAGLYCERESKPSNPSSEASSLATAFQVGEACSFGSVACHGIGVGFGAEHVDAEQLGWTQWSGDVESQAENVPTIGRCIELTGSKASAQQQLLTCCSCSANPREAAERVARNPSAIAEDMEGYGVAMACQLHAKRLLIVRGFSNIAGHRDKADWKVGEAMQSAANLAIELLN